MMGYYKQFYTPWTVESRTKPEVVTFEPLDLDLLEQARQAKREREERLQQAKHEQEQRLQQWRREGEYIQGLHEVNKRIQKSIRPGWIYFELNPTTKLIKIGFSQDLKRRHKELERIEGDTLETLGVIRAGFRYEKRLHRMFYSYRWYGEWFEPADLILRYIRLFTEMPPRPTPL